MVMEFSNFQQYQLSSDKEIKPFKCSDEDLNGFLFEDALQSAIPFYKKCGFEFFTENDCDDETRLMFFDLKNFAQK
jgi:hypothetical protein